MVCATIASTGGGEGERGRAGERGRQGGERRSRQVREWPAGTQQQLVFSSEREKGGKEKAVRGERQRGERKGHIQTLTMGLDDKRMMVFVYNQRRCVKVWMHVRSCCC